MLANMRSNIAFRYHDDLLELRIVNLSWSLPTDVSGNIDIAVGAFSKALPITDNTSNSVSATVSDDDGQAILAAMNKSTQMQVRGRQQSTDRPEQHNTLINPVLPMRADSVKSFRVLTLGKAKPLNVSLVGSTKAATAFKTCAGVKGGSSDPGSNPFQ